MQLRVKCHLFCYVKYERGALQKASNYGPAVSFLRIKDRGLLERIH